MTHKKRGSRSTIQRTDFVEGKDYARARRLGGGPSPEEMNSPEPFDFGRGEDAEIMRATFGNSPEEFEKALEHEEAQKKNG